MSYRDQLKADFLSNRTSSAELHDCEVYLVAHPIPLLDLRTVPREEWDAYLDRHLLMPPAIASFFADSPPLPLPTEQADAIAQAVEDFHGITAPYYADMSTRLQTEGRAWGFVPEVAPYVSGFYFGKA